MDFFEILTDLGYELHDRGKLWSTRALYRGGDNQTALAIYKSDGSFYDFVTRTGGKFETLVRLSLGEQSEEEIEKFLKDSKYKAGEVQLRQPKLKTPKIFDVNSAINLAPDYSFFNGRGISDEVLGLFKGGVAGPGQMEGRFVFPIFNEHGTSLYGFAGRNVLSASRFIKWKLLGLKKFWAYPLFLNSSIIHECREVILVESIGDMLALWEAGFKNVLVLFGVALNSQFILFNRLVRLNPHRIIIALNNDKKSKENRGQIAAESISKTLGIIFDPRQIVIAPPTQNDFGVMNKTQIHEWYSSIV